MIRIVLYLHDLFRLLLLLLYTLPAHLSVPQLPEELDFICGLPEQHIYQMFDTDLILDNVRVFTDAISHHSHYLLLFHIPQFLQHPFQFLLILTQFTRRLLNLSQIFLRDLRQP